MIVEAAIGYEISYMKRGSRKPRTAFVHDTVPVKLPEVERSFRAVEVISQTGHPHSWRIVDGRLYYQHIRPEHLGHTPIHQLAGFTDDRNPLWLAPPDKRAETPAGDAPVRLEIREILSDTRAEAISAVSVAAASMFAWKGALLSPSLGPRLSLHPSGKTTWGVHVDDMPPHRPGITGLSFRAMDLEEMVRHAAAAGMDVRTGALECKVTDKALHLLPGIRDQVLLAAARSFLMDGMPDRNAANFSFEHMGAHLEYTDEGLDRDRVSPELVRIVRRGVEGAIEGRYRNDAMKAIEMEVAGARFALAGWDARPEAGLGAEEGFSPAP